MTDVYRSMVALTGERFTLTTDDPEQSAELRGIYDRRTLVGEVGGAEVRVPDFLVGVVTEDLPHWAAPGNRIDIRGETLQVTSLDPDGAGRTAIYCRAAA